MAKTGSNFWLGFIIGLLAALLGAAILVLIFPRLRPVLGDSAANSPANMVALPTVNQTANQTANQVNSTNNAANTVNSTSTSAETNPVKPQTADDNIRVTMPANYETIDNPVVVSGESRTFEQVVSLRVRDGDGRVLAETFTTSNAPDLGVFGPYSISINYSEPSYDYGSIEVFENSAKDGSEINKVVVPIYFAK